MRICLYADHGAELTFIVPKAKFYAQQMGYKLRLTSALDITNGILDQPDIAGFILGGSRSGQLYRDRLGIEGQAKIRAFVAAGGGFLGICAGAYLACEQIDYRHQDTSRNKVVYSDLAMMPACAEGELMSLYHPLPEHHARQGWHWAAVTPLELCDGGVAPSFYWGGGAIMPLDENAEAKIKPLARFNTLAGKPIAMASMDYHDGVVVVSAVHPEVTSDGLQTIKGVEQLDPLGDSSHRLAMARDLDNDQSQALMPALLARMLENKKAQACRKAQYPAW